MAEAKLANMTKALDLTYGQLFAAESAILLLKKDNLAIPILSQQLNSLRLAHAQQTEQLKTVREALVKSQLENAAIPELRADNARLLQDAQRLQDEVDVARAEAAERAVSVAHSHEQVPMLVHQCLQLQAELGVKSQQLRDAHHRLTAADERKNTLENKMLAITREMEAVRHEREDLVRNLDSLNRLKRNLQGELVSTKSALEQAEQAHSRCADELRKEVLLREQVESRFSSFLAEQPTRHETEKMQPFQRLLFPDMRKEDQAPIAGVGILVGKFSEHSGKAGKVYILSLAPGSAAAELQRKSRASKGVPDIAENDLLISVDDKPVDGMEIELIFDALRGPEGSQVSLELARKNEHGVMQSRTICLQRMRPGACGIGS